MVGQNVFDCSFKRCLKVKVFDTIQASKVHEEVDKVDQQLLFQRLSAAAQRFDDDIPNVFSYELCIVPSSLFDGTLYRSDKEITKAGPDNLTVRTARSNDVLPGTVNKSKRPPAGQALNLWRMQSGQLVIAAEL